jgi:hypothetical protein
MDVAQYVSCPDGVVQVSLDSLNVGWPSHLLWAPTQRPNFVPLFGKLIDNFRANISRGSNDQHHFGLPTLTLDEFDHENMVSKSCQASTSTHQRRNRPSARYSGECQTGGVATIDHRNRE